MSSLKRALWFIERDLYDITLEDLAQKCDLTASHITRMFALCLGTSMMRYVRARRLSEAAKRLIYEPSSILTIALECGYGSHEAFSRAFCDCFGQTPQSLRALNSLDHLNLMEPNTMPNETLPTPIPRREHRPSFRLTGQFATYQMSDLSAIPAQWRTLRETYPEIYQRKDRAFYAVNMMKSGSNELSYGPCVLSTELDYPPEGFTTFDYPASDYVVFSNHGHVSTIGSLWKAIYSNWQADWGRPSDLAPPFELFDHRFDSNRGEGLVEIWAPIQAAS